MMEVQKMHAGPSTIGLGAGMQKCFQEPTAGIQSYMDALCRPLFSTNFR